MYRSFVCWQSSLACDRLSCLLHEVEEECRWWGTKLALIDASIFSSLLIWWVVSSCWASQSRRVCFDLQHVSHPFQRWLLAQEWCWKKHSTSAQERAFHWNISHILVVSVVLACCTVPCLHDWSNCGSSGSSWCLVRLVVIDMSHAHVEWLSSTSPFTSLPVSSSPLSSYTSYCLSPSTSLMSWTTITRTSAEERGPLDKKNSSSGCDPNDHFVTEASVEFTQESSVTEQRSPEDFDYDDITIGQTLLNACRRRADHCEGEGLSSVCRCQWDMIERETPCLPWRKSRAKSRNSETKTLKTNRLGLSWTDKKSESSLTVKRRIENANSRQIMTEEVYKNWMKRSSHSKNFIVLKQRNDADKIVNFFIKS